MIPVISILKIPISLCLFIAFACTLLAFKPEPKEFKGRAVYFAKSKMELGRWGARMSEAQKKQIAARLKNRLEKEYILTFNKEEAVFYEDEK